MLLLFGEVLVLHDLELGLGLPGLPTIGSLALGQFSLSGLTSGHLFDVLEEAVIVLSDQVQAARFAVLLKFGAHELRSLLLVGGDLGVVEEHAVLVSDELREEVVDVGIGVHARVHLTIDTKSAVHRIC